MRPMSSVSRCGPTGRETEARLIRLHHLEQRSYGEISLLTGLPVGSIGPTLSKARQKIRDHAGGMPRS